MHPFFLAGIATVLLLPKGYDADLRSIAATLLLLVSGSHSTGALAADPSEVRTLCKNYEGTVVSAQATRTVRLSCDQIRRQFERQLAKTAREGSLFGNVRALVYSLRNQNLNDLKVGDLPKDQTCSIVKNNGVYFACTAIDADLEVTTEVYGTPSGHVTKAVLKGTTDFFKRVAVQKTLAEYGSAPTDRFLDYYVDLLFATSNRVGGAEERYSRSGSQYSVVVTVR